MRSARSRGPSSPRWGAFLREHTKAIWACDFLQLYDAWFRPIFAFFLVEHATRRVVQVGVTRSPSDAWVAQQLRNATPDGEGPRFLESVTEMQSSGKSLTVWPPVSASRSCAHPFGLRRRTPSASASSGASAASVWTTSLSSASDTYTELSPSTWSISTGIVRTRGLRRRSPQATPTGQRQRPHHRHSLARRAASHLSPSGLMSPIPGGQPE